MGTKGTAVQPVGLSELVCYLMSPGGNTKFWHRRGVRERVWHVSPEPRALHVDTTAHSVGEGLGFARWARCPKPGLHDPKGLSSPTGRAAGSRQGRAPLPVPTPGQAPQSERRCSQNLQIVTGPPQIRAGSQQPECPAVGARPRTASRHRDGSHVGAGGGVSQPSALEAVPRRAASPPPCLCLVASLKVLYAGGPQSPGCRPTPVPGLSGTGHPAGGEQWANE